MPDDHGPRVVGPYRILRPLGSGAMAVVWVAEHRKLRRRVALKRLNVHDGSPEASRRFERESRIAASLHHPRIVAVHDYLEHGGSPYIAMELVPGGTLRSLIGHLTQEQTFGVLADVLEALAYTEERQVVHRDIKPDNVLVTTDGRVKLADFGIAKLVGDGPERLTASGIAIGTPEYMAPEQATADTVSPATDLYAVGMLAYHLLAGRTPFDGEASPASLMFRQVNEIAQRVDFVDPGVDSGLADWVEWLLRKDPRERPHGAAEAWAELAPIVMGLCGEDWRARAALPVSALPESELDESEFDDAPDASRTAAPGRLSLPPLPLPPPAAPGSHRRVFIALAVLGLVLALGAVSGAVGMPAVLLAGAVLAGLAGAATALRAPASTAPEPDGPIRPGDRLT